MSNGYKYIYIHLIRVYPTHKNTRTTTFNGFRRTKPIQILFYVLPTSIKIILNASIFTRYLHVWLLSISLYLDYFTMYTLSEMLKWKCFKTLLCLAYLYKRLISINSTRISIEKVKPQLWLLTINPGIQLYRHRSSACYAHYPMRYTISNKSKISY